ncbi:MAG: RAMP superfamily protein [Desulfobacteraceae bacterium]|nr:MAG: RAMP superfamily protein [Desulfobacteraceae bacterium]
MLPDTLRVRLLSDTTCGCGEGTPGEVDVEIEHDSLGLPVIGGKTIHGLLKETWLTMKNCFPELWEAGERVFGLPGTFDEVAILRIGKAQIPGDIRRWVEAAASRKSHPVPQGVILRGFTDIRRQTSISRATGTPKDGTLRSSRVAVRGLILDAPLMWVREQGSPAPTDTDLKVLAMAASGSRHIGLARNRGRGYVKLSIFEGPCDVTGQLIRAGGESGC